MSIGVILQHRRKEIGLTQESLCEGICSITYISKVENGVITPKEDTLELLCDRLGLSKQDLEMGDTKKQISNLIEYYEIIEKSEVMRKDRTFELNTNTGLNSANPLLSGLAHIIQARYALAQKEPQEAKIHLNKSLEKEKYLDKHCKYLLYKTLGFYEYIYGSKDLSLSNYLLAKELHSHLNMNDEELFFYLGLVYSRVNDFRSSTLYINKALEIYNEQLSFKRIFDCNLIIGVNYNRQGNFDEAEKCFNRLLDSIGNHLESDSLSKVYHNLGLAYLHQEDIEPCIENLTRALELKDENSSKVSSLYLLAYAYKQSGEFDSFHKTLKEGYKYVQKPDVFYYRFKILELSAQDKKETLLSLLENEAYPYFRKVDSVLFKESTLLLGNIYKKMKHYKKSSYYFEQYVSITIEQTRKELLY